jgi:hypothetical protein
MTNKDFGLIPENEKGAGRRPVSLLNLNLIVECAGTGILRNLFKPFQLTSLF